ncbi:hypothetical protein pb186bvf_012886 [Paramecium bursaria]
MYQFVLIFKIIMQQIMHKSIPLKILDIKSMDYNQKNRNMELKKQLETALNMIRQLEQLIEFLRGENEQQLETIDFLRQENFKRENQYLEDICQLKKKLAATQNMQKSQLLMMEISQMSNPQRMDTNPVLLELNDKLDTFELKNKQQEQELSEWKQKFRQLNKEYHICTEQKNVLQVELQEVLIQLRSYQSLKRKSM